MNKIVRRSVLSNKSRFKQPNAQTILFRMIGHFCLLLSFSIAILATIVIVTNAGLLRSSSSSTECTLPCIPGDESIMDRKQHGTSNKPVQNPLRWNCDNELADRICNFNRRYAEYAGYWKQSTTFMSTETRNGTIIPSNGNDNDDANPVIFYDSNTGKEVFRAPIGRTWDDFIKESTMHGWPSFRDDEVNWDTVRVLPGGETVSIDGTHLGHNLPDTKGRRYCINLVSIAGYPITETDPV